MSGIAIIALSVAWLLLGVAVILLHNSDERRIDRLEHRIRAMERGDGSRHVRGRG